MAAVRRISGASVLVVLWSLGSCALALSPAGTGGVPRAVNSVAFLLLGPGVAMATLLRRRYAVGGRPVLAPGLVAVISETFSITLLVLTGMALLLVGAWSVTAVVAVITAVAVLLAMWPTGTVSLEALHEIDDEVALVALPVGVGVEATAATLPAASAPVTGTPTPRPPSDEIVMWS